MDGASGYVPLVELVLCPLVYDWPCEFSDTEEGCESYAEGHLEGGLFVAGGF